MGAVIQTFDEGWNLPLGIGLLVTAPVLLLVILVLSGAAELADTLRGAMAAALVALATWATFVGWKLVIPGLMERDLP